ncbi:MAG: peptidoglycan-binding protein [bacterium]|nr:peptidoglycan-binding protein [bacterium]
MIWCSDDMDLLDDDDWNKYQVVGDNFHGWAPGSAGCVTVQGGMKTLSGDWKTADNWIYNTNKDITYFSAAIFQYEDLITKDHRLRIGSKGEQVKELQKKLNKAGYKLKIDGDFGPVTHHNLRQYQQKMKIGDNGIYIIPPEAEKAPKKGKAQKTGLEAILKAKSKTELLRIVIKAGIITDPASNKADILKAILDSYTKAINGLDKSYRKIELSKINLSSTEAMKGITQNDAVSLAKELSIKSIKDLGRNKHFQNARIISVLSDL